MSENVNVKIFTPKKSSVSVPAYLCGNCMQPVLYTHIQGKQPFYTTFDYDTLCSAHHEVPVRKYRCPWCDEINEII